MDKIYIYTILLHYKTISVILTCVIKNSRRYLITMASVEPAGIIPSLNRSFGKENAGS